MKRLNKRVLACFCTLAVLFSAFMLVHAADATITVESKEISTGVGVETVEIPLVLSDNPGILGMTLNVTYSDGLTLTGITGGNALTSLYFTKPGNLVVKPFSLVWDGLDGEDTSNGTIATLSFEVPKTQAKEYTVTVTANGVYDDDVNEVSVTISTCKITVSESSTPDISLSTVDGAQIRTTGNQGLRFISSIDKTTVDFDRVVEYGTVLIPTADLTDISELVIGATLNGHAVAKVAAKNLYEVTDSTTTFTAVLTNIKEKNYAREYTARAYAILDDGSVVYADSGASRSIYTVAKRGLENSAETEANKAVFQAIVDAVETV